MSRFSTNFCLIFLIALPVTMGGCEQEDTGSHSHSAAEGLAEEFCEHMEGGPAIPLTAAVDTTIAPDASTPHTRYDLALVDNGSGEWSGAISYASPGSGNLLVATSKAMDIVMTTADGSPVAGTPNAMSSPCGAVAQIYSFSVSVGPYTMLFGPADVSEVMVVIELDDGSEPN